MGDLGTSGSRMELMKTFSDYGDIEDVWVAKNPPGFAFVYFRKIRDARDAVHALDGQLVCGRRAKVQIATGGKDLEEMRMIQQERAQMSSDQHFHPRRPISVSPPHQRDSNRDRHSSSYRGGSGFGSQRSYGGSGRDSYSDRGQSYTGGSYGNRGGRTSSYRGRDSSSFQSRGRESGTNEGRGYSSRDNYGGGRDNYGGGRDNYGGGRDNYGGGRDNYGGGRDNYGGGRDNYGGGRDNYGGGRDNYGGGRDNYGGGRDSRWRDNMGGSGRDNYGDRQRGRDSNYQQTRNYRGRDSGMYEARDNYRGRDNYGGSGSRDNFGDRQQGSYRQSYRGGQSERQSYQRSYNQQGYQQRSDYRANRRTEGGRSTRARSHSASPEKQGSYSPFAGRETRREHYSKEKYRSRSRSPVQVRASSSAQEEGRAQLSHHSSPSRVEGEYKSPEATGSRYTRRRYDNEELFEDDSHAKMSLGAESGHEDSLEEKGREREHWDEDGSPTRFRM